MSQAVQEILNCFTPEDRLDVHVAKYVSNQPTLHNILEEQRPWLHCGGSLKSRSDWIFVLLYLHRRFLKVLFIGFLLVTNRSVSKIAVFSLLLQMHHPFLYLYYADSRMTQVMTILYVRSMREGSELVCSNFFLSFITALLHIFHFSPCACVNTFHLVLDFIIL